MTAAAERLAALVNLDLMMTPAEERFDRITRLARDAFDVPLALINLLDDEVLFTKSPQVPGEDSVFPKDVGFCDVTIQAPRTLVVNDALEDPRFAERPAVTHANYRFYAGRPLAVDSGQLVGTLCLFDHEPREFSAEQEELLEQMALWVERELQETADRDRDTRVQQSLLPSALIVGETLEVDGMSTPFDHVGGDYYAWSQHDGVVELTIADAMGKGVGAAIMAATVRAMVLSESGSDISAAVRSASERLAHDFTATQSFATLFHARVDSDTGRVDYVDAGHGLTIIVRAAGGVDRLASSGFPLGVLDDSSWPTSTTVLHPGDVLVAFTDGLLDLFDGTLGAIAEIEPVVRGEGGARGVVSRLEALCAASSPTDDVTAVVVVRR